MKKHEVQQTEADRLGFTSSQYNAAIRLQCAVRDTSGTRPTLEEALNAMTAFVRAGTPYVAQWLRTQITLDIQRPVRR